MAPNLTPNDVKQGKGAEGLMVAPLGIPLIDISELDGPKHDQVVESIVKAAQTSGFFQVVNHGLSVEFLDEMRDSIHRFHNQPEENKAVYLREVSSSPLVTFMPNSMPEMVRRLDGLSMTYTNEQDALKYWPDSYKEVALKYLKTSKKMAERILQVLMSNLGVKLDKATVDACTGDIDLFLNYYPSCPNGVTAEGNPKHTDSGTLTVLLQDHVGGLFCKLKDDGGEGEWVEIKSTPGALLILLGDCLEVLSNGKYKGGEHCVQRLGDSEARVSSTIFMKPRSETRIRPLPQVVERDAGRHRYKEFLYGEYLESALAIAYSSDIRCSIIDTVRI